MRRLGIALGAFVAALVTVGLATGQVPFGGFGGFGGGGGLTSGQDPVGLLRLEQVKKELDVTDEQMDKIPAAVNKALKEVLNEQQHKRLRQIQWQLQGVNAYTDADVQTQLKLSAEQKENITNIIEDARKERRELAKDKGGDFKARGERFQAIDKEAKDKVAGVLTADQRKAFRQMTGDEFKLEFKGFGGGNFKGFKKKDTQ
jgi:hypothetical protein